MKELEQYLEGLDATFPEAFYRLAEVIKCQVLELCGDCIPYMMNDALEYYLQMKGLRTAGTYHPGITIESARSSPEMNSSFSVRAFTMNSSSTTIEALILCST